MSVLRDWLDDAVRTHVIPAAQAAVFTTDGCVYSSAHGAVRDAPITEHSVFDIASLTKLVATTAVVASLRSERAFDFDDPVSDVLPAFGRNGKQRVTVRELLAHASGLPAWRPLFRYAQQDPVAQAIYPSTSAPMTPRAVAFDRARSLVVDHALTLPLEAPGVRAYSDIGFIALGEWIEALTGNSLAVEAEARVFAAVGASQTRYFDLHAPPYAPNPIVPTGSLRPRPPAPGQEGLYALCTAPPALDPGCVDDDNAYAMGGVAGHAGVFSTATDVGRIGWALLEDFLGAGRIAKRSVVQEMFAPDRSATGAARGLGVDLPSVTGSSVGSLFGQRGPLGAVGHLGFTGCSLWLDLDREAVAVLLTNRVLPGREHSAGIRALRPAFHDQVARWLDGGPEALEVTDPGVGM